MHGRTAQAVKITGAKGSRAVHRADRGPAVEQSPTRTRCAAALNPIMAQSQARRP